MKKDLEKKLNGLKKKVFYFLIKKKRLKKFWKRKEFKIVLKIKNGKPFERVKEKKLKKFWRKNWKCFLKKKIGRMKF